MRRYDQRAICAVRDDEAVRKMVQLTTEAATFVDVAHQLASVPAIFRVLHATVCATH